jgi:Integral peroxisomal membrane peroxin
MAAFGNTSSLPVSLPRTKDCTKDTPWLASMSPPSTYASDDGPSAPSYDPNPPTVAAFSPQNLSGASTTSKQRSTIIVHKKSPLLVATPPQVTRALAYSHPFLLPLNKLAGLLSWSTDDPWESFLLVAGFWAITLYGNELLLWTGPILVVIGLILGMYSRRYSPLSSTSQTGEKHGHKREPSDITATHHKSLDEIVEALRVFTSRCNILLEPFLSLTDFLSTQRTATSATTRPALTTLFIRILFVTPLWILLTLPPLYILTSRRVILTFGTIILTWHSRPARVSRVILWRSLTVRRICSFITGLSFEQDPSPSSTSSTDSKVAPPTLSARRNAKSQEFVATDLAMKHRAASPGVRFTFILYENQRRWIGLGWTSAMLAYERASWTDEHLNPAPSKDRFELPHVESGTARWRWVKGSTWKIEGASSNATSSTKVSTKGTQSDAVAASNDTGGWIYYDNKWNDGKRDADSWGKYTRRRKWYRDAELVEVTSSTEITPNATPTEAAALSEAENDTSKTSPSPRKESDNHRKTPSNSTAHLQSTTGGCGDAQADNVIDPDSTSSKTSSKRKSWFGGGKNRERRDSKSSSVGKKSLDSAMSVRTDPEDDHVDRWKSREHEGGRTFGLSEDAVMGLS